LSGVWNKKYSSDVRETVSFRIFDTSIAFHEVSPAK